MSSSSGISANSRVRTRRARRASTSATARLAAASRDPYRRVGGAVLYFAIGSLAGQFIGKLAGQPLGIRATAMRLSRDMSVKSILRAIALGSCLLVLTTQVVTAASANSWSVGPSMNAARYGHSATVLLDGRVLVAGGGSNPDAEIYNPASGTWSPTGPMTVARADHAAVRLADGRVLVISGNYYAASSAEIYDPASNSWHATGSLNIARNYPQAVLLKDGRVLAAGGQNPSTGDALNSAELYNASTGAWTLTGSLKTGRYYHTATLLNDGTVLVATGFNASIAGGEVAAAERYNPQTGKWTSAGSMAAARRYAAVVRLQDGRVLVAGGDNNGTLSSAELYDPATNSWKTTGSMVVGLGLSPGVLLPDGRVLVAGHSYDGDVYQPSTGTWSLTGYQIFTDLEGSAAWLLPNGTVLLAGGAKFGCDSTGDYCQYTPTNTVQIYSP